MAREYNDIKMKLRNALKKMGAYKPEMEFRIEIAAGAGLLYARLVKDIEQLQSPVVRDNEDMDFVAAPDEAVKLLPKAAKEYHNALVALGLAENTVEDPKPGRPANPQYVSDNDELTRLMNITTGGV
jgi:hypothetical protein